MNLFRYPWFPYLFAMGLPLTLYSHNQAAFAGGEVLRSMLVFLLIATLLVVYWPPYDQRTQSRPELGWKTRFDRKLAFT